MTVVSASHLSAGRPAGGQLAPSMLRLTGSSSDLDRFSLNSNLSDSSPLSGLASPLSSASDHGSQVSIAYSNHTRPNSTDHSTCMSIYENDHDHDNDHHHHHHHHLTHGRQSGPPSVGHKLELVNNNNIIATDNNNGSPSIADAKLILQQHRIPNTHQVHNHSPPNRHSALSLQPDSQLVPARRPSRTEHRQSLSDLGYGKMESYAKLQRLGKGTYATVYMGRSRLSNDLVALKEILKEHDEGAPCTAIREVSLLRLLRHNNIVTLHDICHTPKKLTLVFEYVGPDLYAYMKDNNHLLSMHNVRLLLYQLLRGISFCHARHVLHRDLKPQNLLINTRGELKICDFGLARAKSIPTKSYSNEVVTLWYRPPDVLLGNTDYDHSIDMWGVGCIFFEMASGRTFFPGSSVRQQLYLIFSCLGAPNKYNWPEILNNPEYLEYNFPTFRPEKLIHRAPRLDADGMSLLLRFLRYRPNERISAEEAKRDPFFACLPEKIHLLNERESIFDIPGVHMTLNPGQKLNHM